MDHLHPVKWKQPNEFAPIGNTLSTELGLVGARTGVVPSEEVEQRFAVPANFIWLNTWLVNLFDNKNN